MIYFLLTLATHSRIFDSHQKIAKQRKLSDLLKKFVSTFQDPRHQMTFANKGTVHFAQEQDRALLCAVDKHGYGNWDQIRETLINDDALLFQHPAQSMNNDAITKRVDYRMRQMERELEAREKKMKNVKPPTVLAAEESVRAILEMETWEDRAYEVELKGLDPPPVVLLSEDAKSNLSERMRDRQVVIERFREVEIQLRGCKELAAKTHESIMRNDQYVNYSNITLKCGGQHITENGSLTDLDGIDMEAYVNKAVLAVPECGECKSCTDRKTRKLCVERNKVREEKIKEFNVKLREWVKNGAKRTKTLEKDKKDGTRQYWPRKRGSDSFGKPSTVKEKGTSVFKRRISPPGNPLGNKKMAVPIELLPDLCRKISADGTRKRMQTIQDFSKEHPTVSIRQVTFKFAEVTTKDRPPCIAKTEKPKGKGRAFIFFLRPKFYSLLPENERPEDWERYWKEDEILFLEESRKVKEEKAKKAKSMKDMMDDATVSSQAEETSIATSMDMDVKTNNGSQEDDDITEEEDDDDDDDDGDDPEPLTKKARTQVQLNLFL